MFYSFWHRNSLLGNHESMEIKSLNVYCSYSSQCQAFSINREQLFSGFSTNSANICAIAYFLMKLILVQRKRHFHYRNYEFSARCKTNLRFFCANSAIARQPRKCHQTTEMKYFLGGHDFLCGRNKRSNETECAIIWNCYQNSTGSVHLKAKPMISSALISDVERNDIRIQ